MKSGKHLIVLPLMLLILFNVVFSRTAMTRADGDTSEIKQKLEDYFGKKASTGFSGAVLVAKDDQIIFNSAYGFGDKSKGIQNTPESVFDIGSVSKQFTAAAIMKLEMTGKLKTTDTINKFLSDVPADKQNITIHQLLRN